MSTSLNGFAIGALKGKNGKKKKEEEKKKKKKGGEDDIEFAKRGQRAGSSFENSNPMRDNVENDEVWVEHLSENGESYFHQPSTGETVWDRPDGEITPASLQMDEKWLKADEGNGDNYWYDETSGRTTWSDRSQG
ncbi:hypothetical protein TL16_g03937 [Triparma laevis f. inornata]|uniref:WW domain-containing protein n=1 Tax=Triparma laevis f. inornata TaxID=1714386 RepID=A0A9W7A7I1_9STRA|nr:hypothetical protein TL16_g03937 [Triparma laevis f. inornata]